jgi:short-subunit dehydrogenase
LEYRVIVVTGAARGIGESTARRLAQQGARLALWDRDEARLESTATSLKGMADVEPILYEQGTWPRFSGRRAPRLPGSTRLMAS